MKEKNQNNDRLINGRQQHFELILEANRQKMLLFNADIEEKRKLLDKVKGEIKELKKIFPAATK